MTQEDLPFELIVTILLLLPAESLIRLMSVSKAWYALITSAKFIQNHLQVMASRGNEYILCGPTKVFSPAKSDLLCAKDPNFAYKIGVPSTFDSRHCLHVSSSYGLVLMSDAYNFGKTLYFWNPCIRKYRCISSSCIDIKKSNRQGSSLAVGFGYLNQTKEYRIVRIASIGKDDDHFLDEDNDYMDADDHDDIGGDGNEITEMEVDEDISASKVESSSNDDRTTEVEVYSLTTDSWRKVEIQSFPWFLCDYFTRAFVNNYVHWMVFYRHVNEDESMILAFDLKKEAFQQITLPYYEDDVAEHVESIVYKEALGFVVIYPQETTEICSLWEMKEYGVVESWSKVFNVKVGGAIYRPFTLTKNDQIMFDGENQGLSLYSFQSQEIKTVTVKLDSDELDFLAIVDSLILLEPKEKLLEQGGSSVGIDQVEDKTSLEEQMSPVKDASMGNEFDEGCCPDGGSKI